MRIKRLVWEDEYRIVNGERVTFATTAKLDGHRLSIHRLIHNDPDLWFMTYDSMNSLRSCKLKSKDLCNAKLDALIILKRHFEVSLAICCKELARK